MLDKNVFIGRMIYLNNFYKKFEFDIKNEALLMIWYDLFKEYDNNTFGLIIKTFCENEIYPPQSPSHIINVYKDRVKDTLKRRNPLPNEAFEIFRKYNIKYGGLYYNRNKVISALKQDYPLVCKTVKIMESELSTWTSDNYTTPKKFKELYESLLNEAVELDATKALGLDTSGINKMLDTKLSDNKLLESRSNQEPKSIVSQNLTFEVKKL